MSSEPSMLTPVGESCPAVDLPLPPQDKKETCKENNAYLNFADKVESDVGRTVLKVGIAVDSKLTDILGSISNLTINGVSLTAAYAALLLIFPDLDSKIQKYEGLAAEGWRNAQKKQESDNFSAGYVNYILPPTEEQKKWIEDGEKLEKELANSNALVRAIAQSKHQVASLVPTADDINKGLVRGAAKALNVAANVTAATVKGTAAFLTMLLDATTDGSYSVSEDATAEENITRTGTYLDTLSNIGQFFNKRQQYFNDNTPYFLQGMGPFAPYAILSSLAAYSGLAPQIVVAAIPLLSFATTLTIKSAQAVESIKGKAAIESVKFVLLKMYDVLKETKIPQSEYSDLIARTIVAISCPAYIVRDSDQQLFSPVDKKNVTPFLYFLRYAAYAYCLDPNTLGAADVAECNELNKVFSRRYYRIMDNVKGVEGLKKGLINFFIVYDLTIGCFVISFQGTTTLDDVLLDAFGKASPFSYTDATSKDQTTIDGFAHESMLLVAKNCVALILEKLKKDHPFYQRIPIITTGHSLGAGVASIAALLLRQERCYAFSIGIATPACMSPNLAEVCQSYVVSIINNADIVPRLSECALFNLSSSDRICARSENLKKLVAPGNVFWMREVDDTKQEMVQLHANNPFATSILARVDCLIAHATSSYLKSLKAVNPSADPFAIELDFSLLLPTLPKRKLEPEFLMLYLPPNVAATIKSCINKRTVTKASRAERRKEENETADTKLTTNDLIKAREEFNQVRNELVKQYTAQVQENKKLQQRIKELEK